MQRTDPALARFGPEVRDWFASTFGAPTPAQVAAWASIAAGDDTLLLAPTGSGKTLASFLWSIDQLLGGVGANDGAGVRLLYISPLKALNADIERNLAVPLDGVRSLAAERGTTLTDVRVFVRTGDTKQSTRASIVRRPPEILVTTPESLYLMLTAPRAREVLRTVRWVIVDEIHSIASNKRGTHLAVSLERLAAASTVGGFQRIGLSATARPVDAIARLLGGADDTGTWRPVSIADATAPRPIDLRVEFVGRGSGEATITDDAAPGRDTLNVGDAFRRACERVIEEIDTHTATLVFAPARGTVEQMVHTVNELCGDERVRAHHGSVAHDVRAQLETALKAGDLPALVCTNSLEMGIDMGPLDCVVNYTSPGSAAAGLQRIGRSGHGVGRTPKGRFLTRHPADLLETAAVAEAMLAGDIEPVTIPDACFDVLAQHVVSIVAAEPTAVDDLLRLVRRAAPFHDLSAAQLNVVLRMLDGGFADERYRELQPRILIDAATGLVHARPGARQLATTNGGTIPDRGEFTVRLDTGEPDGIRLGSLDEEFAIDLQRDQAPFILGTSTWRMLRMDHSNVWVRPAPGEPAMISFWNGERRGRSTYLSRRVTELCARIDDGLADPDRLTADLAADCALDGRAAATLVGYCAEQKAALGVLPSSRAIPVEWFHDEIGDLRIVLHSLFGYAVNGAWAHALKPTIRDRFGNLDPQITWNSDGVIIRLPGMVGAPDLSFLAAVTAGNVGELLVGELADAPMFALRFRESAQRALLLPRGNPARRTPLWLQRQRAADLLSVVRRKEGFPIVHEAVRECYQEVWDVEGLRAVLRGLEAGEIAQPTIPTAYASPFAANLEFDFARAFGEDGDAPRGECRAAFLALDRRMLQDVLRTEELRSLLDPDVIAEVRADAGRTAPTRRARDATELLGVLVDLGDLDDAELAARCAPELDAAATITSLAADGRITRHPGCGRWVAAADAARGVHALCVRHALWAGPITLGELALRYDLATNEVHTLLDQQEQAGLLTSGHYLPTGTTREWCAPDVLARMHRRTLQAVRTRIRPVPLATYAAHLQAQHTGGARGAVAALADLAGAPIAAPMWERGVLPTRIDAYDPTLLDAACAGGDWLWTGAGHGLVRVHARGDEGALLAEADPRPRSRLGDAIAGLLAHGGGWFAADLARHPALAGWEADEIAAELYAAFWAGEVATDTFAPIRHWLGLRRLQRDGLGHALHLAKAVPGRWQARHPAMFASTAPAGTPHLGTEQPASAASTASTAEIARLADELLDRYGIVTKQALKADRRRIGWAPVYAELRLRALRGDVVQGYFVEGVDGAQFARAIAVDRLRDGDRATGAVVFAGADPANVWGRLARLPSAADSDDTHGRPADAATAESSRFVWRPRQPGNYLLTRDGTPLIAATTWGRALYPLVPDTDLEPDDLAALACLATWRGRPVHVERWRGGPPSAGPVGRFTAAGWTASRGNTFWIRPQTASRTARAGTRAV